MIPGILYKLSLLTKILVSINMIVAFPIFFFILILVCLDLETFPSPWMLDAWFQDLLHTEDQYFFRGWGRAWERGWERARKGAGFPCLRLHRPSKSSLAMIRNWMERVWCYFTHNTYRTYYTLVCKSFRASTMNEKPLGSAKAYLRDQPVEIRGITIDGIPTVHIIYSSQKTLWVCETIYALVELRSFARVVILT